MIEVADFETTPIPEVPSVTGWQEVPIQENGENLVSFADLGIPFASFYSGLHDFSPYHPNELQGAYNGVYVREGFGEQLVKAQRLLPSNMSLLGLDGHRRLQVQSSLYYYYYERLNMLYPDWTAEQLQEHTVRYVSKPSSNPNIPAPHNTGGSLDLWIVNIDPETRQTADNTQILASAVWLPAGAKFDHGGEKAALRHYEEHDENNASEVFRRNRRTLYWLMREVGIEAYPDEYWHYNFGNQMAAKTAGNEVAVYGVHSGAEEPNPNGSIARLETNFPVGECISPVAA